MIRWCHGAGHLNGRAHGWGVIADLDGDIGWVRLAVLNALRAGVVRVTDTGAVQVRRTAPDELRDVVARHRDQVIAVAAERKS